MKKALLFLLIILIFAAGCTKENADNGKDDSEEETEKTTIALQDLKADEIIAQLNDHEITGEDVRYEIKRLELIDLLSGNDLSAIDVSPDVAVQELIRTTTIHHIAHEEGISIDSEEQQGRAQAVRKDVEVVEGYEELMEDIDVDTFWTRETDRYQIILEAEQLITQLMEKIQDEHPNYDEQALRFDAQKELDEWIQEKVLDMELEIKEIED